VSDFHVPKGPPVLRHLFDMHAELSEPEVIGPVAEGMRMNFYVRGGWFRGERLRGEVCPVGGDWITLRSDGIGQLDVRATLRCDDGAMIYTWYSGLLHLAQDQRECFARGEMPAGPFRITTAPMYRCGDSRYAWLNRVQAVARGWADAGAVQYRVFSLDEDE